MSLDQRGVDRAIVYHGPGLVDQLAREEVTDVSLPSFLALPRSGTKREPDRDVEFDEQLVSFIAKKADLVFKRANKLPSEAERAVDEDTPDLYAIVPPLEAYMEVPEELREKHFHESIAVGDIVIGSICSIQEGGLILNVLCFDYGKARDIHSLNIQATCSVRDIPHQSRYEEVMESFKMKELIRGVVVAVASPSDKVALSLHKAALPREKHHVSLGLIEEADMPVHYRRLKRLDGASYAEHTMRRLGFSNVSSVSTLCTLLGLTATRRPSLMRGLCRATYPKEDYAVALRNSQSHRWAFKSVAEGVAYFKRGKYVEAMQYLNKALQMDSQNVEAYVARGALYANSESYAKALEDFAKALEFDPRHQNAKSYMYQTLLVYARSLLDAGDDEAALRHFEQAVNINPDLDEARNAIRKLRAKMDTSREKNERNSAGSINPPTKDTGDENVFLNNLTNATEMLVVKKDLTDKKRKTVMSLPQFISYKQDSVIKLDESNDGEMRKMKTPPPEKKQPVPKTETERTSDTLRRLLEEDRNNKLRKKVRKSHNSGEVMDAEYSRSRHESIGRSSRYAENVEQSLPHRSFENSDELQSPYTRDKHQSSYSGCRSPEDRARSSHSQMSSTERRISPGDRQISSKDSRSREEKRTSHKDKGSSPDARQTSVEDKRSGYIIRMSPGDEGISPDNRRVSHDDRMSHRDMRMSYGDRTLSDDREISPGDRRMSHDNRDLSPSDRRMSAVDRRSSPQDRSRNEERGCSLKDRMYREPTKIRRKRRRSSMERKMSPEDVQRSRENRQDRYDRGRSPTHRVTSSEDSSPGDRRHRHCPKDSYDLHSRYSHARNRSRSRSPVDKLQPAPDSQQTATLEWRLGESILEEQERIGQSQKDLSVDRKCVKQDNIEQLRRELATGDVDLRQQKENAKLAAEWIHMIREKVPHQDGGTSGGWKQIKEDNKSSPRWPNLGHSGDHLLTEKGKTELGRQDAAISDLDLRMEKRKIGLRQQHMAVSNVNVLLDKKKAELRRQAMASSDIDLRTEKRKAEVQQNLGVSDIDFRHSVERFQDEFENSRRRHAMAAGDTDLRNLKKNDMDSVVARLTVIPQDKLSSNASKKEMDTFGSRYAGNYVEDQQKKIDTSNTENMNRDKVRRGSMDCRESSLISGGDNGKSAKNSNWPKRRGSNSSDEGWYESRKYDWHKRKADDGMKSKRRSDGCRPQNSASSDEYQSTSNSKSRREDRQLKSKRRFKQERRLGSASGDDGESNRRRHNRSRSCDQSRSHDRHSKSKRSKRKSSCSSSDDPSEQRSKSKQRSRQSQDKSSSFSSSYSSDSSSGSYSTDSESKGSSKPARKFERFDDGEGFGLSQSDRKRHIVARRTMSFQRKGVRTGRKGGKYINSRNKNMYKINRRKENKGMTGKRAFGKYQSKTGLPKTSFLARTDKFTKTVEDKSKKNGDADTDRPQAQKVMVIAADTDAVPDTLAGPKMAAAATVKLATSLDTPFGKWDSPPKFSQAQQKTKGETLDEMENFLKQLKEKKAATTPKTTVKKSRWMP